MEELKNFPKLYKIDNKGKVRVWWITAFNADEENHIPWYSQTHGVLGGQLQCNTTDVAQGKNIGKSNETTAYEQCKLEAESLWTKQRDRKGYSETMPTEKPFGPMLAKSYDKDGRHIKFPCYVQPKLDGLRCIAKVSQGKVTLWSRQNKQFKVLSHIEEAFSKYPDGIYDGELYLHDATFQDIVGAIKRDEANDLTSKIQYHIYDIVEKGTNLERIYAIQLYQEQFPSANIIAVPTLIANTPESLVEFHKRFTSEGYEGIMVRNKGGAYKVGGRSADLQKYKVFMDQEFEIIGAEENKGKLEGTCVFVCKTDEGGTFKVMPEGSEEQRTQYFDDWNEGKIKVGDKLTVKFFSWSTSTPKVPRFPIGKGIRNGE